jgi:hypothetical protein
VFTAFFAQSRQALRPKAFDSGRRQDVPIKSRLLWSLIRNLARRGKMCRWYQLVSIFRPKRSIPT